MDLSDFKFAAVIAAYPAAAKECRGKTDDEIAARAIDMAKALTDKIDFGPPSQTRAKKQALTRKRGN